MSSGGYFRARLVRERGGDNDDDDGGADDDDDGGGEDDDDDDGSDDGFSIARSISVLVVRRLLLLFFVMTALSSTAPYTASRPGVWAPMGKRAPSILSLIQAVITRRERQHGECVLSRSLSLSLFLSSLLRDENGGEREREKERKEGGNIIYIYGALLRTPARPINRS